MAINDVITEIENGNFAAVSELGAALAISITEELAAVQESERRA